MFGAAGNACALVKAVIGTGLVLAGVVVEMSSGSAAIAAPTHTAPATSSASSTSCEVMCTHVGGAWGEEPVQTGTGHAAAVRGGGGLLASEPPSPCALAIPACPAMLACA